MRRVSTNSQNSNNSSELLEHDSKRRLLLITATELAQEPEINWSCPFEHVSAELYEHMPLFIVEDLVFASYAMASQILSEALILENRVTVRLLGHYHPRSSKTARENVHRSRDYHDLLQIVVMIALCPNYFLGNADSFLVADGLRMEQRFQSEGVAEAEEVDIGIAAAHNVEAGIDTVGTDIDTVGFVLALNVDHSYYGTVGRSVQGAECNLWDLSLHASGWFGLVAEDTGKLVHNAVASDVEIHTSFWLMDTREVKA